MKKSRIICLLLVCLLLSGCMSAAPRTPPAERTEMGDIREEETETEPQHSVDPMEPIRVYFDGLLCDRGYIRDGQSYISFQPLFRELGIATSTELKEDDLSIKADGFELYAKGGVEYMTVNGRYVFLPGGFLMVNGEPYFAPEAVAAVFGVDIETDEEQNRVDIPADGLSIISGGENYYTLKFDSADVFWLSRIIYAEATYQPLAGRIAVGNVILNRVAYPEYPDNVYDVIFDTNGGIQFDPAYNGTVYNDSDELSLVAAYLALDGVNTCGDCYFFVNPDTGITGWFLENLEYVTTIAEHDFYTLKAEDRVDGADA